MQEARQGRILSTAKCRSILVALAFLMVLLTMVAFIRLYGRSRLGRKGKGYEAVSLDGICERFPQQ